MSNKNLSHIDKILESIDSLLIENKEQKLKTKLAEKIRESIFTDDIVTKMNECDFSEIIEENQSVVKLFDSIFPIFVKKDTTVLSDDMKDRYIYMFNDGRLTSGLFQCFNISDDEYVYGIKKIIDAIELFKKEILLTLENFKDNIDKPKEKINYSKEKEKIAIDNYNKLIKYLTD